MCEYIFLNNVLDTALLFFIALLCYLFIDKFFSKYLNIPFASPLEKFVFYEVLGLGLLAYFVFFLGIFKLLYKWIFYLCIFTLVILVLDKIIVLIDLIRHRQIKWPKFPALTLLEITIIVFGIISVSFHIIWNFWGGFFGWDALLYHLSVPKLFIEHHQIFNIPDNMRSYWIMTQHMLLMFCLLFRGIILTRGLLFLLMLLTGLAVYTFTRRYFPNWVALLASIFYISEPFIFQQTGSAYTEIGLALFEFLALYAFIQWYERQENKWLILSGIFCGFAVGSKYTGILSFIAILALIVFYWLKNRKVITFSQTMKNIFSFSAIVVLIASAWYVKNYIYCGNPVFPYLNNVFKSPYWHQHFETADYAGFTMGYDLVKIIMLPWNLGLFNPIFGFMPLGLTFIAFLPLLLILPLIKKDKFPIAIKLLIIYSLVRYLFFSASTHFVRYFTPVVPVLVILSAYCVYELVLYLPKFLSKILFLIIFLLLILHTPIFYMTINRNWYFPAICTAKDMITFQTNELNKNIKLSLGLISPLQYSIDRPEEYYGPSFVLSQYVNKELPKDAKVFLVWEELGFLYDRQYIYDLNYLPKIGTQVRNSFTREFYPFIWKEGFYELLKKIEVNYIVINFHMAGIEYIDFKLDDFSRFKHKHLKLIHKFRELEVYKVL